MDDPQWVKKFREADRPGLYVRVVKEGVIKTGDPVSVEIYTSKTISIVQMYREYYVKDKSEESLRQHLNAPIDIRSRRDLEEELNKLLAQK